VRSQASPASVPSDRTLANLGYADQTIRELGGASLDYAFYVPAGQTLSSIAYLDLAFARSQLLDDNRSGFTVYLNGQPITTILLTDENIRSGVVRILFPSSAIQPGRTASASSWR